MIREEIFRRLPSNIQNKIQKCTNSLTSITGHQLSILGECHLKLHTDKEGIIVRMIICRKLPFPCILGVDTLRKYGIIWNPTSNEIKITSPTIKRDFNCTTLQDTDPCQTYELQLNNKVTIEAGTCIQVLATTNTEPNQRITALIEGYTLEKYPSIFVESQLLTIERGTAYLKVSNLSNQKVKIPKIKLGVAEQISHENIRSLENSKLWANSVQDTSFNTRGSKQEEYGMTKTEFLAQFEFKHLSYSKIQQVGEIFSGIHKWIILRQSGTSLIMA